MNHIPYQIQKQRLQLQELTDSKALFGSMVKLRDVTEVMLRLPVLCAGAFILAKGGSEKELLTLELVKHDKIDSRGWLQVANIIHKNENIPNPLKSVIEHVCSWIKSEKLIEWRHSEIAHGALKLNPDDAFVEDFENKIKSLDNLLMQLETDYQDISISDDGSTVTYMGETLPVMPYIHSDSGEAYLFDTYRNGLAKGLCYALGLKRAIPSEAYVQAYMSQVDRLQTSVMTGEVITAEMSKMIDELNEAANFEPPIYLREWLMEGMCANDSSISKGTLLLEMERGMGKSAFVRALDGKSTDSSYRKFKLNDTFTRAYYCSRIGIRSKGDFLFGVRNSLLTDEQDQLLYSSDEKIPSLSENGTPEDFAALLNWCYDHINEKQLLLIIDGIDEIPIEHSEILKMLPTAEMLKDGVYILITCRSKEQVKDGMKDQKLIEDENRQIETVRSYVYPNLERAYTRDEQHNLDTLRSYFDRKILPKNGKKNKSKERLEADIQTIINEPGQRRFLEVRIIGTLIKSGKVKDIVAFAEQPDLFQYYLDYLRTEEYGDAVFSRLTELLAALACAQEELTFGELAYLLGEDDVTMQLLTFVCDMSGILRISRDYRGNHISLASDEYRTRILEVFPDTVQLHKQAVADILECIDIEALKTQADDKSNPLPDGLLYAAAYLPIYTEQISIGIRDLVCNDLFDCIKNFTDPNILNISTQMGEVWENYCERAGWYKQQIRFINITEYCYSTLCEYDQALEWKNKHVNLCHKYLKEGKIEDEKPLSTAYLNRGNAFQSIGKYDDALRDYGECLRIRKDMHEQGRLNDNSELASAYMNHGNALQSKGDYEEALCDYRECIRIMEDLQEKGMLYDTNDLAKAYLNHGNALQSKGDYEEALRDYEECIHIMEDLNEHGSLYDTNDLATAYMNRGGTYLRIGKYDEALREYGNCIRIREDLQAKGRLYKLNDLASAYMNRGNTLLKTGKFNEAQQDYGECISIRELLQAKNKLYDTNDLASAYMNRGNTLLKKAKYDEALRDYRKCIKIMECLKKQDLLYAPNDLASAYMNRGVTYNTIGKFDKAKRDFGKCIRLRKSLQEQGKLYDLNDLAKAYMNRGVTYDDIGKYDKALSDYRKCIKIRKLLQEQGKLYDPNDLASAYMNRGTALQNLCRYMKALKDYDKCIVIRESLQEQGKLYDPDDLASAYMNRGVTYDDIGKYDEALRDYEECIRIREELHSHGRLYDWHYSLGSVWLNKGILLADGLHNTYGALEIFNHAIMLLESDEKLSFNANEALQRLRYQRDRLTEKSDSDSSFRSKLESMSDDDLKKIIDIIAQRNGEDCADFVESLRQMDRSSLIDVFSQIIKR